MKPATFHGIYTPMRPLSAHEVEQLREQLNRIPDVRQPAGVA